MLLNSLMLPVVISLPTAGFFVDWGGAYLEDSMWAGAWLLSIVVSLKIVVNALISEEHRIPLAARIYPRVNI